MVDINKNIVKRCTFPHSSLLNPHSSAVFEKIEHLFIRLIQLRTRLFIVLLTLLLISYPCALYFGLYHVSPRYIALGLAVILLLRYIFIAKNITVVAGTSLAITTLGGLAVSVIGILSNQSLMLKLYPLIMSLLMFGLFFSSLLHPPTIIERVARFMTPDLPLAAIDYTRKVTIVWSTFFILNAIVATWTIFYTSMKVWTLYNGIISYIIIGVIFVTEFIYRQWAKRKSYL